MNALDLMDIEPEYRVRRSNIDVVSLNSDTPANAPLVRQDETKSKLLSPWTAKQEAALKSLTIKTQDESMDIVAKRAGVGRQSLYRWLEDIAFARELQRRVILDCKGQFAPLMKSLIESAMERGPGQAAIARIVLEKIGVPVIDHSEHVNRDAPFEIDELDMPVDVKRLVVQHMEEIENLLAPYRPGGPTPPRQLPAPQAPRNVTPLAEVELHPAPCDLQSPTQQD